MTGGNLRLKRSELVEIDPHGREPPFILVLNQFQVVAGFNPQGFERRRRKGGLPLGRDLDPEGSGHAGKKTVALPECQTGKAIGFAVCESPVHPRSSFLKSRPRPPPLGFDSTELLRSP